MLGSAGKLFLFFQHQSAILLSKLRLLLDAGIGVLLAFAQRPRLRRTRFIQEVGRTCQLNVANCQEKHCLSDYLFPRLILVLLLGLSSREGG
jgi:hypothetical protein